MDHHTREARRDDSLVHWIERNSFPHGLRGHTGSQARSNRAASDGLPSFSRLLTQATKEAPAVAAHQTEAWPGPTAGSHGSADLDQLGAVPYYRDMSKQATFFFFFYLGCV
jgi:hypothetical protein